MPNGHLKNIKKTYEKHLKNIYKTSHTYWAADCLPPQLESAAGPPIAFHRNWDQRPGPRLPSNAKWDQGRGPSLSHFTTPPHTRMPSPLSRPNVAVLQFW